MNEHRLALGPPSARTIKLRRAVKPRRAVSLALVTLTALTTLALTGLGLTACNTFEGAGRDMQSGGKLLQDAARGTSDAISGDR